MVWREMTQNNQVKHPFAVWVILLSPLFLIIKAVGKLKEKRWRVPIKLKEEGARAITCWLKEETKPGQGKVKAVQDVKVDSWECVGLLQPPNTLETPLQGSNEHTLDDREPLSIRISLTQRKRQYMHLHTSSFCLGTMPSKETRQHAALLCIVLNQQDLEQVLMEIFG